ncbi:hypothetical protein ABZV67_21745 [Streptomyces sp. NPDC005065]|uniref:hypothetical protein n=1 Tax=Streptomyces sp. NPDC005065 TaxID=3154461 RepID=UPI0033AABE33
MPLHALTEDNLPAASPDLLRAMVKTFADAFRPPEADTLSGAEYGQVSDERVNQILLHVEILPRTTPATVESTRPRGGITETTPDTPSLRCTQTLALTSRNTKVLLEY